MGDTGEAAGSGAGGLLLPRSEGAGLRRWRAVFGEVPDPLARKARLFDRPKGGEVPSETKRPDWLTRQTGPLGQLRQIGEDQSMEVSVTPNPPVGRKSCNEVPMGRLLCLGRTG